MKLAYVAGPYRAKTESGVVHNIRSAEGVAVELWRMGFAVICPHKNTALFGGLCPDETWLKGDLEMLRRCDLVVLVPGWEKSSGTRAEVAEAQRLNIPRYLWPQDRELLTALPAIEELRIEKGMDPLLKCRGCADRHDCRPADRECQG